MQAQALSAMTGRDTGAAPSQEELVQQSLADFADAADAPEGSTSGRTVLALSVDGPSDWQPTAECPKPVIASIRQKLSALEASTLEVLDDSAKHAGHAGARETNSPSGETHFKVRIVSEAFQGLNVVKRHRMVYGLLADELAGPVHALNLDTKAPSEV